jgi:hypothetical protein
MSRIKKMRIERSGDVVGAKADAQVAESHRSRDTELGEDRIAPTNLFKQMRFKPRLSIIPDFAITRQ